MPTTTVSTDIIINTIVSGRVDAALDGISSAIKARKQALNEALLFTIKPGDIVKFNSQANPKYLQGQKAVVVKVNRKTVSVNISDDAWGARRYRGARNVRTPISIVDKVS